MASNGLSYDGNFRIKFQQYGYDYISYDGFAFDDIHVYTPNDTVQFMTSTINVSEAAGIATVSVYLLQRASPPPHLPSPF
jgi:hypothetical protein